MRVGNRQTAFDNRKTAVLSVTLGALLLALCVPVKAQQAAQIPRIGYVQVVGDPARPSPNVEAFLRGLRDLGHIDGKSIAMEYRYLHGKTENLPRVLAELVQLKVDVIVSGDAPTIRAAKQATKTIPIVMLLNEDPVATGLVDSLARPGGNITGISRMTRELAGKRLDLLQEIVPGLTRVGLLWDAASEGSKISFREYQAPIRALKMQLQSLEVRGPNPDLKGAFQSAVKGRSQALIVVTSFLLNRNRQQIVDLAINHRLPVMYESSLWIEPGGLISYSSSDAESYRRAAAYVDRILKGAKPAELPVEQPTKFEFVINLKTAKQIGVNIPQSVLFRADKVIR